MNGIPINIKKLMDAAVIPTYATAGSSGFDLYATEHITVAPYTTELIPTGIAVSVPFGFELQVRPRSGMSLNTKMRVANSPGTIDSDYRGEVKVILENSGPMTYNIKPGDRIAQGVICPIFKAIWREVKELDETERADGGFGSSDKI